MLAELFAVLAPVLIAAGIGYGWGWEEVGRAMMLYDVPYPGNPQAIRNKDWGMERINFQGWPYRSATELVVNDLKKTLITGDAAFLDKLDAKFVANDLVNYTFIRKALDANPKWKNDHSVPKTGDPFVRTEAISV